ncbi:6-phosphogluconolactonase [Microbulbifer thermotolerans]|uniref:6-phosphogluconolactonase n=1 Tax=Microbulbifer thermotolerans TaxID=252514 RepID=UPI0008E7E372|nr:6-phosphogluconolactonase [Microbulbifer thermotolerans]MCX2783148.1 6-phosphogluconolactonase [Microbulbifer thermotolerans]WKT61533.1 6-phosphogluconolactonase [Microbulbifer thermotolerans]SFB68468.1 6-phosphogluconolactonase [Microbulbifer thermotolerans]
MVEEKFYSDRERLVQALVHDCASELQKGIKERGQASFLVSGGSTPEPVYRELSKRPLPWPQITVALVDERWVDRNESGSNQAFIEKTLLQNCAAEAPLLAMKTPHATAAEGEEDCERAYAELPKPFDVCILGMGSDGHTASLFPHADGLAAALNPDSQKLCSAITARQSEVTGVHTERMTLTLAAILQARDIKLLITGNEKLKVYREALLGSDELEMPVRSILKQGLKPVTVYWAP